MTVNDAIEYCYKHRNEYLRDTYAAGEDDSLVYVYELKSYLAPIDKKEK